MKSRQTPPLIDPSVLYLLGFILFVAVLGVVGSLFVGNPFSATTATVAQRNFPSESEASSSIRVGQSIDDVTSQFGEPTSQGSLDGGLVVMNYMIPSYKDPTDDASAYAGFAVYVKDGKVVDMTIIRHSDVKN